MNYKLFIVLILLFTVNLHAQVLSKYELNNSNIVPDDCDCLTFVSECSGQIVPDIKAKLSYYWCDGTSSSQIVPVGENGQLCGMEGTKGECPTVRMCIEDSDWEVCEILGCEVRLKKTLSQYPKINGQLIGYGANSPGNSSAYKNCERIHTGELNNPAGVEEILYCSGDEAILDIRDLSLAAGSGYCLTVNILRNKAIVKTRVYNNSNGSSVPITDLLAPLEPGEIYALEMIIACCNENETDCTLNTRKIAYFKLLSPFSFTAMATDGAIPGPISLPFTPATSSNGTILENTFQIFPLPNIFSAYTLTLSDVINSIGAEVSYQLYYTRCNTNPDDDFPFGTPGLLPGIDGQAFPVIVVNPVTDCDCYRLELVYKDGCGEEESTSNYYFQVGADCIPGIVEEDPSERKSGIQIPSSSLRAKLKTNPIEDELIFDIFEQPSSATETILIKVFDISGQLITRKLVAAAAGQVTIPFDQGSGMYIYTIEADGELFTGKVVKK